MIGTPVNSEGFPIERTPRGYPRSGYPNERCGCYPCHYKGQSCLFCYCPLYNMDCPGNPQFVEINGKQVKDCSLCTWNHDPNNEDKINDILREEIYGIGVCRN